MSMSTAQPIRALAGPFLGALDVQPLQARSCCSWSSGRPAGELRPVVLQETSRVWSRASRSRGASCPTCGPLEAAPHAPLNTSNVSSSPASGRDGVYPKGHKERLCLPREPR